ncbi:amidohydrolase family protein, partial [Streptococcus danieliae]|nr:amidohydrolase family protein [Streptococcus danieliae]
EWGLVNPEQAIRMASLNPALSVGLEDDCGQIRPGAAADFLIWTPQLDLHATYLNGQLRFQATSEGKVE